MKKYFWVGICGILAAFAPLASADSASGTTTVSVTVGPEASLTVDTATTSLTTTGTVFNDYTGTTNLTYKIRTSTGSGTGSITAQVQADFAANGPSVASGDLTYTCTVSSPGSACSQQTASTSAATPVATFGADAHSADTGNSASTTWTLKNRPQIKTGTYSVTVTYTISAT